MPEPASSSRAIPSPALESPARPLAGLASSIARLARPLASARRRALSAGLVLGLAAFSVGLASCRSEDGSAPTARADGGPGPLDAGPLDAGRDDAGGGGPGEAWTYAYVAPDGPPVELLRGERWRRHWIEDVRPYWITPEAVGVPEGNFPTFRGMDGSLQGSTERRPRMLGRQTYVYAIGYLLTGEARLLELARAGARWLLDHARDADRGGWHARLDETGAPAATRDPKLAQDTAYCLLGLAAWYFVTRDPEAEAAILEARDLLFDEARYWDAAQRRIKDGLDPTLSVEVDAEGDQGWELVAQLDPINAFLLLSQPVLREPARRAQLLGDLETLARTLVERFWSNGLFWGVHNQQGRYGARHVDYGHTLKTYWMLLEIDKRLPEHPLSDFLAAHARRQLERAKDQANGRWAKRPRTETVNELGSDWWIHAEADQLAAVLDWMDHDDRDWLARTQSSWLEDYVDDAEPVREVIPSIKANGDRAWGWRWTDTAKCNEWKNGYHSTEHALVLYLAGRHQEAATATLHFAVAEDEVERFEARPYVFRGTVASRTPAERLELGGRSLRHVEVGFVEIH